MKITEITKYRLSDELIYRKNGDVLMVYNKSNGDMYEINHVGISHDDLDQIILVSEFIPPYFLMEHMDKIKGCVSHVGSEYSHVGLICKARQIPYLVAINIDSNWNGQNGQIDLRNEIFRVGKEASKAIDSLNSIYDSLA